MPRTSRPITVTLGELQSSVDRRVKSGAYTSTSEVLRDAVKALDRQDEAFEGWLRRAVEEAENDPGPAISGEEMLEVLRKHRAEREKRKRESL